MLLAPEKAVFAPSSAPRAQKSLILKGHRFIGDAMYMHVKLDHSKTKVECKDRVQRTVIVLQCILAAGAVH